MGDLNNLTLNWRSMMLLLICVPVVIAIAKLCFNKVETISSRFLAAAMFVSIMAIMPQIIGFAGFYEVWPGLTFFPFNTDLWLGPLLYLHAYSLMTANPIAWRKYLLIPGILQTLYYSYCFLYLGDYKAKWKYNNAFHDPYIFPVETIISIILLLGALILIWKQYVQYRQFLDNTQSTLVEFDPTWIKRTVQILCIASFIFVLFDTLNATLQLSYVSGFPFIVAIMLCLAWLSIEAIWRLSQAFPKPNTAVDKYNDVVQEKSRYNISGHELKQQVLNEQWYLQARFSLKELASKLGSNEAYVSRAINQDLELSFNDFINGLRVEHAKVLINEALAKNKTLALLPIALDSGFNSKATFNRVFKQTTSTTPSQYTKQNKIGIA